MRDGSVASGLPRNVVKGGDAVTWPASRRPETGETTSKLRGSMYAIAQRYDKSLGLRVLDVFAISGAWLLAGVAAFDDRADAAALRNLLWFIGVPVVISMIVNQLAGLYGPVWRHASVGGRGGGGGGGGLGSAASFR